MALTSDVGDTIIRIRSSSSHELIYTKTVQEIRDEYVIPRAIEVHKLFTELYGTYLLVIPRTSKLAMAKIDGMRTIGTDVLEIERKDWPEPPKLPTDRTIIFYQETLDGGLGLEPTLGWLKSGYIEKDNDHYVFNCLKLPEMRKQFVGKVKIIESWVNARQHGGIKFPDCDKYHLMSTGFEKDPQHTFINGKDDCKCGRKGNTFTVSASSLLTSPA